MIEIIETNQNHEKEKTIAVTTGTFDPPTIGHLKLIENASKLCDELIIILAFPRVKKTIFTIHERKQLLENEIQRIGLKNVQIVITEERASDYAIKMEPKPKMFIRGVRDGKDYDDEMKRVIAPCENQLWQNNIIPIFIPSNSKFSYISSTYVRRQVTAGKISNEISNDIHMKLKERLKLFTQFILEFKEIKDIPLNINQDVSDLLIDKAEQLLNKIIKNENVSEFLTIAQIKNIQQQIEAITI